MCTSSIILENILPSESHGAVECIPVPWVPINHLLPDSHILPPSLRHSQTATDGLHSNNLSSPESHFISGSKRIVDSPRLDLQRHHRAGYPSGASEA